MTAARLPGRRATAGRQPSAAGIVGILLAAGRGQRFGADKRLARLADGTMLAVAACRTLVEALGEVVAVVRPEDDALAAALRQEGAQVVACQDAERGMGRSLAHAVDALADARGWVVALADMPWIRASTIAEVAKRLDAGGSLVAPCHRGTRGHPVGFGKDYLAALRALDGDQGARELVRAAGAAAELFEVDDPGVLRDVDRPGDLAGAS